jgi:hypothetical protein
MGMNPNLSMNICTEDLFYIGIYFMPTICSDVVRLDDEPFKQTTNWELKMAYQHVYDKTFVLTQQDRQNDILRMVVHCLCQGVLPHISTRDLVYHLQSSGPALTFPLQLAPAAHVGSVKKSNFEFNQKPGVEAPDESDDVRLPSLGNNDGKVQEGLGMSEYRAYMDYYDGEVGMTSVDSMVTNEAEDEKDRMCNMAIEKNG